MFKIAVAILAAGSSLRFGSNKLTYDLGDGDTLLERAIRACADFSTFVVAPLVLRDEIRRFEVEHVLNDEPARGMSYSARLANAVVAPDFALALMPADLRCISRESVRRFLANAGSTDADITFPMGSDGTAGHPVVFSPRVRHHIATLPDGDTIRQLRDRGELRRKSFVTSERWPFIDVDYVSDLAGS